MKRKGKWQLNKLNTNIKINYINENTWIYHKNEIKAQTQYEQTIVNPRPN